MACSFFARLLAARVKGKRRRRHGGPIGIAYSNAWTKKYRATNTNIAVASTPATFRDRLAK